MTRTNAMQLGISLKMSYISSINNANISVTNYESIAFQFTFFLANAYDITYDMYVLFKGLFFHTQQGK